MSIKNIMEDLVCATVTEVLDKEKAPVTLEYKEDICAHVLNRIPVRYITSERGILHGLLESKFHTQQKTDILMLIHEAIVVIQQRRNESAKHIQFDDSGDSLYFPYILGEIVEETTFSKIDGAGVTLLREGKVVEMMSGGWENPFITNRGTMSYFHFWPKSGEPLKEGESYEFKLIFKHECLNTEEYSFSVQPVKALSMAETHTVPIQILSLKKGADSSCLYDE